jgi:hypothetical protein
MRQVVTINVVSGSPRPWTFYTVYQLPDLSYVASRRSEVDLGWRLGQLIGLKDGEIVGYVATLRTCGDAQSWSHVFMCGSLIVVEPDDYSQGIPTVLYLKVDDA